MRVFLCVLGLSAFTAVICGIMSQVLPVATNDSLFAEAGPFERASPWFWIGLSVLIVLVFRRATPGVASGVVLSLAAAAREWDMHKSFTGYSVLKPGFYTPTEHPFHQQIIAGVLVVAVLASAFYLVRLVWKLRPWASSPRPAWLFALAFACFMLVFTKVLDRAPAIIREDLGVELPVRIDLLMAAWEEGLEMLLAVYFAGVVLSYASLTDSAHYHSRASSPG